MKRAIIGIVMCSGSDMPIIQDAAKLLKNFELSYELITISVHQIQKHFVPYIENVIIAARAAQNLPYG